jgi:flagellar protein FlaG
MRIESTDASTAVLTKTQSSCSTAKDVRSLKVEEISRKNISQITELERRELPISERVVINAIEKANKAIMGSNRKFEFSIHEGTKEIMVKVIDSETEEIIREIPPEKVLDMVARLWEMAGIIVDERR